jgi:FMN phosphatase YigB (HAD superfamily)
MKGIRASVFDAHRTLFDAHSAVGRTRSRSSHPTPGDVSGAGSFGLRAVWINRLGTPPERLPGEAGHELRDLSELPELLRLRL